MNFSPSFHRAVLNYDPISLFPVFQSLLISAQTDPYTTLNLNSQTICLSNSTNSHLTLTLPLYPTLPYNRDPATDATDQTRSYNPDHRSLRPNYLLQLPCNKTHSLNPNNATEP